MTNTNETSPVAHAPHESKRPLNASEHVDGLEIGVLMRQEARMAIEMLARGMRDNPLHIAAFGNDPDVRLKKYQTLMVGLFAVKDLSHTLVARQSNGVIVGVCGMMRPGDCLPTAKEKLRLVPRLLALGPKSLGRVFPWLGVWGQHDPAERHWHLGPLAVDSHLQGQGIGSQLLRVFCAQMDAAGEQAYLETDKPINVTFYERFGFKVIHEDTVIGVPNWFMLRQAH